MTAVAMNTHDKLWRSQLHDSLQAMARSLGLVLPDDDSRDWMLVAAGAVQTKAESMAPPAWVTMHSPEGETLFRCTGCGATTRTPTDDHSCSPRCEHAWDGEYCRACGCVKTSLTVLAERAHRQADAHGLKVDRMRAVERHPGLGLDSAAWRGELHELACSLYGKHLYTKPWPAHGGIEVWGCGLAGCVAWGKSTAEALVNAIEHAPGGMREAP